MNQNSRYSIHSAQLIVDLNKTSYKFTLSKKWERLGNLKDSNDRNEANDPI